MTTDKERILEWYESRHGGPPIVRETHISFVLLGERYVYKFKKAVKFSFIDYSTPDKRLFAARQEIVCNSRLTTGVYLGLCLFDDRMLELPSLRGPEGDIAGVAEVAVVMRRLPEGSHLDRLLDDGRFDAARAMESIARRVADFHERNRVDLDPEEHLAAVSAQCEDNLCTLSGVDLQERLSSPARRAFRLVSERGRESLSRLSAEISGRASAGCVVDGHGDIRLEHICIEQAAKEDLVQIYDCVEFDRNLRIADVASDLAFLAMELDLRGRADLSAALCEHYTKVFHGPGLGTVLELYKGYRALVRAKVSALGAAQASGERREILLRRAEEHIALASRYALEIREPVVFALSGLMGVGKTVLARAISSFVHPSIHSADVVRREIFAGETSAGRGKSLAFGAGAYGREGKRRVYEEICSRASVDLARKLPVVLDASFMYRWQRTLARDLARDHGCRLLMIECRLGRKETLTRLASRAATSPDDPSDGRAELYEKQRMEWEPILPEEELEVVTVDMSSDVDLSAERIALSAARFAPGMSAIQSGSQSGLRSKS